MQRAPHRFSLLWAITMMYGLIPSALSIFPFLIHQLQRFQKKNKVNYNLYIPTYTDYSVFAQVTVFSLLLTRQTGKTDRTETFGKTFLSSSQTKVYQVYQILSRQSRGVDMVACSHHQPVPPFPIH